MTETQVTGTSTDTAVRVVVSTFPNLSPATTERIFQSAVDGLAIATLPFVVKYSRQGVPWVHAPNGSRLKLRPQLDSALLDLPDQLLALFPASQAVAGIRTDVLKVRSLRYTNPMAVTASAKGPIAAIAAFFQQLLLGAPERSLQRSEAARAKLDAIAEEALFDCTIDEKFNLKEMARVKLEIAEEKLKQERLKTLNKAIELKERFITASERARELGTYVPDSLFPEELSQVLDNARTVEAFSVLDLLDVHVELE